MINFSVLWSYRGFIFGSIKREFQNKYRNSLLGIAWTFLNPLAMILVYTVIFSQVMKARLPGSENGYASGTINNHYSFVGQRALEWDSRQVVENYTHI
jgi:ABC-type polysaccharide/polyol phosphate export permease